MHRPIGLWVVMALFAVFCLGYISQTPYRTAGILQYQGRAGAQDIGSPDERQHANYISHLKAGKGFMVLDPKDPNLYENYQAHQPPAYYLLGVGWATVTASDPQSKDSGFKMRLLNLLIGLGSVAGLWFLALWGTQRTDIAAGAAAVSLTPMFLSLHASVSNDPLLFLTMTWSFALLVKGLREGMDWKKGLGLGALVGLAFLTKTTSLALIPLLGIAWIVDLRGSKKAGTGILVALGLAVLMAGGWWMRNQGLYGDPFALKAFRESFTGSAQASGFIEQFGAMSYWTQWVGWWTARSLIGVFGYMDIHLFDSLGQARFNSIYLAILFILAIPFGAGWVALLAKPKGDDDDDEEPKTVKGLGLMCLVLVLVILALFIQFNRQYFQGQARYLYPAVGALAVVMGAGMTKLLETKNPANGWMILAGFLSILNILALMQLGEAFARRVTA